MPNMRIIYDNVADKALSLTSTQSAASASTVVANLLNDTKAAVFRVLGTVAEFTLTWSTDQVVSGVMLPFCNLTADATMRVRGYTSTDTLLFDTGDLDACPGSPLALWNWSNNIGANAFAYAGGTYGRLWFTPRTVRKIVVTVIDSTNTQGYVEMSRLVCGHYWSPTHNPSVGAPITAVDSSKHYRNESGDLLTEVGHKYRRQSMELSALNPSDRQALWDIMRGNGMSKPIFVSLYPDSLDPALEQAHQIYGKLTNLGALTTPQLQRYATTIEFEEM